MIIALSGSSGLIGSALAARLKTGGHSVRPLVRGQTTHAGDISWNPLSGGVDLKALEGVDAVIHLAGENVAGKRWNDKVKQDIRDSRLRGTLGLCTALAQMAKLMGKPTTLICASAIGFYGHRGDQTLTEASLPGEGFLPEVCRKWEESTLPASKAGIRVVNLRIGVVMAPRGGALKKMLTPFRLGIGGVLGNGQQYMSWVSLDDIIGIILFALQNEALSGPVNAVSPNPVTNRDFTKTLGAVLHRPTILRVPAFAARLAFGEVADEALLASARVVPEVLQKAGYTFGDPELRLCLQKILT